MKTTPTWSANITPVLILLGMLLLPMASNAQTTFQKVFGENTYTEIGRFGVKPVTGTCQTCKSSTGSTVSGGYIATGTSTWDQNNGNPGDIYIVRTDNNGNKIWENTYDVNGANGADAGNSIIEITDGSGPVRTDGDRTRALAEARKAADGFREAGDGHAKELVEVGAFLVDSSPSKTRVAPP